MNEGSKSKKITAESGATGNIKEEDEEHHAEEGNSFNEVEVNEVDDDVVADNEFAQLEN